MGMPSRPALALVPAFARAEPSDEARLLASARAGDRAALQALYARFAPSILRFLRDLTGQHALAADATQETFVRAFRKLSSLRDEARLGPWLFGIARHVHLEQRKLTRREVDLGEHAANRPERLTPELVLLGNETAAVVQQALADLPLDRRTALVLRIDHHLAYDDIAELMGWSLAKVKVEIHRGREGLRAALARHDGEAP